MLSNVKSFTKVTCFVPCMHNYTVFNLNELWRLGWSFLVGQNFNGENSVNAEFAVVVKNRIKYRCVIEYHISTNEYLC